MSMGDQGYTIPLDGSRYLMQPPFTPAGVVINNRTDRIATVADGRGWSRSVRPGAVGRFAIDRPDSNYIGQLAAVGTTGECRVTFTQAPIVETGEPSAEGPRTVMRVSQSVDNAVNTTLVVDMSGGSHADVILAANTANTNISISGFYVGFPIQLVVGGGLTLPYPFHVVFNLGVGTDIPMPDSLQFFCNTGGALIQVLVRTT